MTPLLCQRNCRAQTVLYETRLVPEQIRAGLSDDLLRQIETFDPLPFDAGRGAVNWLRDHVGDPGGPWETVFVNRWRLARDGS